MPGLHHQCFSLTFISPIWSSLRSPQAQHKVLLKRANQVSLSTWHCPLFPTLLLSFPTKPSFSKIYIILSDSLLTLSFLLQSGFCCPCSLNCQIQGTAPILCRMTARVATPLLKLLPSLFFITPWDPLCSQTPPSPCLLWGFFLCLLFRFWSKVFVLMRSRCSRVGEIWTKILGVLLS